MTRRFLPAVAVLGALLLTACGSDDTATRRRSGATGDSVDRAFVAQMIPHHRSAVQMAQIARRRGASTFVRQLADDVVRTQTAEISTMRAADRRLRHAHVTMGVLGIPRHMMGMDGDLASLESAKPFDRAFMRMMLPHHQGAVAMANAELVKGDDPELKALARRIIGAQRREIARMRTQLDKPASGGAPRSRSPSPGMPADDGGAMHGTGHSG
jgi:uncharacterized protein (DUF305 family)